MNGSAKETAFLPDSGRVSALAGIPTRPGQENATRAVKRPVGEPSRGDQC